MRKRKYTHLKHHTINDICCDLKNLYNSCDAGVPKAHIHNLVGTALIESSVVPLALHDVSRLLPNMVYDKQKFAAITIRMETPQCTALLFTSGKMVLTGCKNYTACVLASHYIVNLLKQSMPDISFRLRHVKIQNIVGNVDLNLQNAYMDLQRLYEEHGVFCTYQRNMFPGLIYRPDNSPVVLLVFHSGKIVITGGKSQVDVIQGWERLWPFVKQYITPNS
jgi:transcription initiation factor TFIID TATA-box-binding protein